MKKKSIPKATNKTNFVKLLHKASTTQMPKPKNNPKTSYSEDFLVPFDEYDYRQLGR